MITMSPRCVEKHFVVVLNPDRSFREIVGIKSDDLTAVDYDGYARRSAFELVIRA